MGQSKPSIEELVKIAITDRCHTSFEIYMTRYVLEPKDDETFNLYRTFSSKRRMNHVYINVNHDTSKTFMRTIKSTLVNQWLTEINNPGFDTIQFKSFGFTKASLIGRIDEMAVRGAYPHWNKEEIVIYKAMLLQPKNFERLVPNCFGVRTTRWPPSVDVSIIYPLDTISLSSNGQSPMMLPWRINDNRKSNNPAISTFISELVQDSFSNKDHLSRRALEYCLADRVVFLTSTIFGEMRIKNALKKEYELLDSLFEISSQKYWLISSIDWDSEDGWVGEAYLKPKSETRNLAFHLSFGIDSNQKAQPIDSFFNQYEAILDRVHNCSPLMKHLDRNTNQKLEIIFTGNHSLSSKAKKYVKRNTKYATISKVNLDRAIFMTLQEDTDKYSRWLLLTDGKLINLMYFGKRPLSGFFYAR